MSWLLKINFSVLPSSVMLLSPLGHQFPPVPQPPASLTIKTCHFVTLMSVFFFFVQTHVGVGGEGSGGELLCVSDALSSVLR